MAGLDLAVIGNCTVASLISPLGRHGWFCFPRLDADPVFNALLGGKTPQTGYLDTALHEQTGATQTYLHNTAVVETILADRERGQARVVDFCPRFRRYGRMFRPPMLIRRIEPITGRPRLSVTLRPRYDYGATTPEISFGSNHLRYLGTDRVLRVTTDMPLSYLAHETEFTLDRPVTLFIGPDEPVLEAPDTLGRQFLDETIAYWRDWVRDLFVPFDWQEAVIRAAITLKLCSYDDTGAIVAALTTSIPESPGSGRTWDYRYCWLRDAYFTVDALNRVSATRTMESFLRFILDVVHREGDGEIAPFYPIAPGTDTRERIAGALPGFQGDGPVRIGNAAQQQRQNDSYGSIILSAAQMFWDERLPQRGDLALYQRLRPLGEVASRLALVPDAGLWEYRGRVRVHTFSAAMCWAAVHKLGLIARRVGAEDDAVRWLARAGELTDVILQRVVAHTDGWISAALDEAVVDASVLLLPGLGLLPATDPRFLATLDIIKHRLLRDGFVMRYVDPDDFGKPEAAFLVCTFWYIEALANVGRRDEALGLFENVLAHRNHLGLLSEDIAPVDGALWGNFPQTYSQVGLILAAMRLSRSWEEGLWHAL
ncbi:MAG TPA: glycoside hydrolase family 15 protein [Acetobacteraceae bacterium]|jgi:GH15 family glucan-1,4-alpha-glucosidase|nr:glycoside hydrolase family 15 protein [Acetobacteraceae bacterium]